MSFADRDGVIWFDGKMVPWREATTHVLTHTLHYGLGVFEGIRAYETSEGAAIFRLPEHIDRLFDSAKVLNMEVPYDRSVILDACKEVVKQNDLSSAYLRPMMFYGAEGMGLHADSLKTHVIIAAWHWGAYLGNEGLEKGIRVKTSTFQRIHTSSLFTKAKVNGHYVNSILALREAVQLGFDEALMLDHNGFVAEGSGENIFMVKDGVVYTPMPDNILVGITRDTILTLLKELNIDCIERNITRDELMLSDEAFFTGTAAEITPIRELDNCVIGAGKRGPVTEKIQKLYFNNVAGNQSEHKEWLTHV